MENKKNNPIASDNQGLLLIISGPSGVGKTTITHKVEKLIQAIFSVSMTTRDQTQNDIEGKDYFFVNEDKFKEDIANNQLLEHAYVFGKHYGTPRIPVEKNLADGKIVLLEIDVQGAIQVKKNMPNAFAIFIEPPSEEELLRRLQSRQREDEEKIQRRFSEARKEIKLAKESGVYDYFLINDNLEHAIETAVAVVQKQRPIV